jgi:hypothetical protein
MVDAALTPLLQIIRLQVRAEILFVFRADMWRARLEPAANLGNLEVVTLSGTDITGDIAQRLSSGRSIEEDLSLPPSVRDFPERLLMTLQFELTPAGVLVAARKTPAWSTEESSVIEQWRPALAAPLVCSALKRELRDLGEERDELRSKLAERKILERAKGLLQVRGGMTEEQAYRELRRIARQSRSTLAATAERIINQPPSLSTTASR